MNAPTFLDHPAIRQAALPMSVEQYHALSEAGIVSERTELLRGVIIGQMTKSPLQSYLVQLLYSLLAAQIPESHMIRMEQPLTFRDSEPEPDLALVSGSVADYRERHPAAASLVVEVAISTEAIDREKAAVYALAGVEEYWLVLPEDNVIERFSAPTEVGYASHETLAGSGRLATKSQPVVEISIAELFAD